MVGTVSQGANKVGKIAVVTFEDLASLSKTGDNQYRNTSNLQPQPSTAARVHQGMLEGSNVNVTDAMVNLISLSRQFEMQIKMMQTADTNAQRADQLLSLNA